MLLHPREKTDRGRASLFELICKESEGGNDSLSNISRKVKVR